MNTDKTNVIEKFASKKEAKLHIRHKSFRWLIAHSALNSHPKIVKQ